VLTGVEWDAVEQGGLEGDAVLDELEAKVQESKGGAA